MKKQQYLMIFGMIFIALFMSLGTAQETGIEISDPNENYYINEDYNFSVKTFNKSDGQILINSTCNLDLNYENNKILDKKLNGTENYNYLINQGELGINTTNQDLNYNVYCNNSGIGGFNDGSLNAERKVQDDNKIFSLDISDEQNYIILFLIVLMGFVALFMGYSYISTILLIFSGLFLLFNGFQSLISFILIGIGVLVGIREAENE